MTSCTLRIRKASPEDREARAAILFDKVDNCVCYLAKTSSFCLECLVFSLEMVDVGGGLRHILCHRYAVLIHLVAVDVEVGGKYVDGVGSSSDGLVNSLGVVCHLIGTWGAGGGISTRGGPKDGGRMGGL